jgi:hypothetical protein
MAKSVNTPKTEEQSLEPVVVVIPQESTPEAPKETEVIVMTEPSVDKEAIIAKLAELASTFRDMYGKQLNPVFAEIHKALSNAQYKIMQNL